MTMMLPITVGNTAAAAVWIWKSVMKMVFELVITLVGLMPVSGSNTLSMLQKIRCISSNSGLHPNRLAGLSILKWMAMM